MNLPKAGLVAIKIDKLTNSIERAATGEVLQTAILPISVTDLKATTKKKGWRFNWREEARQPGHNVFKLVAVEETAIIQGLVSLEVKEDHVRLHLVESAPSNIGQAKMYIGVPGNLFAYACKLAFEHGHAGNVAFIAKTRLIDHYIHSLGAVHFGGHLMILDTATARRLINQYFKEFQS